MIKMMTMVMVMIMMEITITIIMTMTLFSDHNDKISPKEVNQADVAKCNFDINIYICMHKNVPLTNTLCAHLMEAIWACTPE